MRRPGRKARASRRLAVESRQPIKDNGPRKSLLVGVVPHKEVVVYYNRRIFSLFDDHNDAGRYRSSKNWQKLPLW